MQQLHGEGTAPAALWTLPTSTQRPACLSQSALMHIRPGCSHSKLSCSVHHPAAGVHTKPKGS